MSKTVMINNELIPNLLYKNTPETVRIFMICLSNMQTKWETLRKLDNGLAQGYYKGKEHVDADGVYYDPEDEYIVEVTVKEFKEYAFKQKISKEQIRKMMDTLSFSIELETEKEFIRMNLVEKIVYNVKDKVFLVHFNKENFKYMIGLASNFTIYDLPIIKQFNSKYQLGIYLKYKQFIDTGRVMLGVNAAKQFFDTSDIENKRLIENLKNALPKVNKVIGKEIQIDIKKNKRNEVVNILLIF